MHQGEDDLDGAGGIGRMLVDIEGAFVVHEAVQHVGASLAAAAITRE
jgi:hypothetical protein